MTGQRVSEYPGALNFVQCLGLKKTEKVLLIVDEQVSRRAVKLLEETLESACFEVGLGVLPTEIQADFPPGICKRMMAADVIILAASRSWYQTPTRRKAKHRFGKRVVECYDMHIDMFQNGGLCADYESLARFTVRLSALFKGAQRIRITTENGTDFQAGIRNVLLETGRYMEPGSGGNLPGGEISLGLIENSGNGEICFDLSFDGLGRLEAYPLTVSVKGGKAYTARGKRENDFYSLIEKEDTLRNIAEIGIGTNACAIPGRSVLEDEKKLGTVHFGFGNDTYFGGHVAGSHLDGVSNKATIVVDDRMIMNGGDIAA